MRGLLVLAGGFLLLTLGNEGAQAQAKKGAPPPTETVRYFQLDDFLGDLRSLGLWIIPVGAIVAAAATASGAPHLVGVGRQTASRLRTWLASGLSEPWITDTNRASAQTAQVM